MDGARNLDKITQLILQREQSLLLPHSRKNTQLLDALLHDEFEEVGASGRFVDKQQAMQWLMRENDDFDWALTDFRLRVLSDEMVMANYIAVKRHRKSGTEKKSVRSSIWKKTGDNWAMIYHQGTALVNEL